MPVARFAVPIRRFLVPAPAALFPSLRPRFLFRPLMGLCLLLTASSGDPADTQPKVRAGYTPRAFSDAYVQDSTKAAKNSFDRFLENSAPKAHFEAIPFEETADMIRAMKNKEIDVVGGPPNQIVEIASAVPLLPAFVSEGSSGFFHDAVLLVAKDSPVQKIGDLEGKTLMVLEGAELGHVRLWLEVWALRETHKPVEGLFGKVSKGRSGSQATLACFFDRADACLVPRGAFELAVKSNAQVGGRLRVLGSSNGLPGAVLAFRRDYDPQWMKQVVEVVTHVQDDIFGRQVLNLFHQKRFIPCKPEHLVPAQILVQEYLELRKAYAPSGDS